MMLLRPLCGLRQRRQWRVSLLKKGLVKKKKKTLFWPRQRRSLFYVVSRKVGKSSFLWMDAATWVTVCGAFGNLGLGTVKLSVGLACESPALVSDGAHSFSDLVSDAVALVTYRESRRPPDENHTYGHGKLDAAGALVVGASLLGVACGTAYHSTAALSLLENNDALSGDHSSLMRMGPMSVALLSVGAKELLFRWTKKVGETSGSAVVVANAYHHRSDALSSVASFGGVALAQLLHPLFDPAAGFVVALMVGKAGFDVSKRALDELVDAVDPEIINLLKQERFPTGATLTSLKARTSGGVLVVDARISVTPTYPGSTLTASAAHHVAQHAKRQLLQAAYTRLDRQKQNINVTIRSDTTNRGIKPSQAFPYADLNAPRSLLPPTPHDLETRIREALKAFDHSVTDVALTYADTTIRAKISLDFHDPDTTLREASAFAKKMHILLHDATADLLPPSIRLDTDVHFVASSSSSSNDDTSIRSPQRPPHLKIIED